MARKRKLFSTVEKLQAAAFAQPATLLTAIASQGAFVAPLLTPDQLKASIPLGYPPAQAELLSAGGTPVDIKQTNGLFNLLSQFIVWLNTGGTWTFDPAVVAVGGYNQGAQLWCASASRYLISLKNNNTANFITTPSYVNDGVNWAFAELPSINDNGTQVTVNKPLFAPTASAGTNNTQVTNMAALVQALANYVTNQALATALNNYTTTQALQLLLNAKASLSGANFTGEVNLSAGSFYNSGAGDAAGHQFTAENPDTKNNLSLGTESGLGFSQGNSYPATGRPSFNGSQGATEADIQANGINVMGLNVSNASGNFVGDVVRINMGSGQSYYNWTGILNAGGGGTTSTQVEIIDPFNGLVICANNGYNNISTSIGIQSSPDFQTSASFSINATGATWTTTTVSRSGFIGGTITFYKS